MARYGTCCCCSRRFASQASRTLAERRASIRRELMGGEAAEHLGPLVIARGTIPSPDKHQRHLNDSVEYRAGQQ